MEGNDRSKKYKPGYFRRMRGYMLAAAAVLSIGMLLAGGPHPVFAAAWEVPPVAGGSGENADTPSEDGPGEGAEAVPGEPDSQDPAWAEGSYPWEDDDFVWDDDDSTDEPEEEYPEIEESSAAPLAVVQGGPVSKIFDPKKQSKSTGGKWISKKGRKQYRYPGGKLAAGLSKIDGKYYLFDGKGTLIRPKKKTKKRIGGKTYYVAASGQTIAGWHVIGGKLCYADSKGIIRENTKIGGITLKRGGAAKSSDRAARQKIIARAVDRVTTVNMTRERKLRACWDYLVSRRQFRYRHVPEPKLSQKTWPQKYAAKMLKTKCGDCNSYACAFAAMANDLGYDAWLVYGLIARVRGDEPENYRQHTWVVIRGKYFDPEADAAGWYKNCYGNDEYEVSCRELWRIRYATGRKKKG